MHTDLQSRAKAALRQAAAGCEWLEARGDTDEHAELCRLYHSTRKACLGHAAGDVSDVDLTEWLDALEYTTGLLFGCTDDITT